MNPPLLSGLIAATHTPLHADGALDLSGVERQAEHLLRHRVQGVFIAGTTGEGPSLSLEERARLAQRWLEVTRGSPLKVIVHVGANCLADACLLAARAEAAGAAAIAAVPPAYFKPSTVEVLLACCAEVATAAPATPFYFYHIPSLTGVNLPLPELLEQGRDRIPNLAGIKFSEADLLTYQRCLEAGGGSFDTPFGVDEALLAALALGARGAVGSTYNFAAPLFHRLLAAFARGDLDCARLEQRRAARLVHTLARYGYLAASKAVMRLVGVDVGPPRLPLTALSPSQTDRLRRDLEQLGFFQWLDEPPAPCPVRTAERGTV